MIVLSKLVKKGDSTEAAVISVSTLATSLAEGDGGGGDGDGGGTGGDGDGGGSGGNEPSGGDQPSGGEGSGEDSEPSLIVTIFEAAGTLIGANVGHIYGGVSGG